MPVRKQNYRKGMKRAFKEETTNIIKTKNQGTSLVVRWLTIRLSMQGKWVRSLFQKDPIGHRATKPVHHKY